VKKSKSKTQVPFEKGTKVILIKEKTPSNSPFYEQDFNHASITLTRVTGPSQTGHSELRIKFGAEGIIEGFSHVEFHGYYLVNFPINENMSIVLDVGKENLVTWEEFHSRPPETRKALWL